MGKFLSMIDRVEQARLMREDPEYRAMMAQAENHKARRDDADDIECVGFRSHITDMPKLVKAIEAHGATVASLNEAVGALVARVIPMVIKAAPDIVRRRMQPIEVLDIAANLCAEMVLAFPLSEAKLEYREAYLKASKVVAGTGDLGVMLSTALVVADSCAEAILIAKTREDLPELDAALAEKATHKDHATVQ